MLSQVFHEAGNRIVKVREVAGHWLQAKNANKEVFGSQASHSLVLEGRAAAPLEADGDVVKAISPIA